METLTLAIPDEAAHRLTRQAHHRGMVLSSFILSLAEEAERREQDLHRSTEYRPEMNAELDRRLAQ
jgi:macrodomain Ter protein organizer (MatP/YcbG family)